MRLATHRVPLILLALGFTAACVTRGDIEEIKETQKEILKKLDQRPAARAPQRPQRPRGPDPSKVYAFPVGDSYASGPKDAWVTIVEISDFQ
jgi:protein-disulfide isomerase